MRINDTARMLFMTLVTNIVSMLVLFELVDWSSEQTAGLVAIVNIATQLGMYVFKAGQEPGEPIDGGPPTVLG